MKKRGSTHSLIALSFLFASVLIVGISMKNISTIQADTLNSASDQNPNFLALTVGENQFVASANIDMDSQIIGINGSLISLGEAKRMGIIESIYLFEGRKVLGGDISQIEANQQFAILVGDISVSPTIYLGSVK